MLAPGFVRQNKADFLRPKAEEIFVLVLVEDARFLMGGRERDAVSGLRWDIYDDGCSSRPTNSA